MRLVIGISGASGVWLGYKLLQILKSYTDIETHLMPIITWEYLLQVDHLLQMEW